MAFNLRKLFRAKAKLFSAESIPLEEQWWDSLPNSWEDKEIIPFPRGISPKVNVIACRSSDLYTTMSQNISQQILPLKHREDLRLIAMTRVWRNTPQSFRTGTLPLDAV